MTEEIAATPGWVDSRLDEIFAAIPASAALARARGEYEDCLGRRKAPAAPSDNLGGEFGACRPALDRALIEAGLDPASRASLGQALEALEAEVASGS